MKLNKGKVPLYHQLEKKLRRKILGGQPAAGTLFPTDQQLCLEYGVSRITVRQALKILEDDGLINREQGRGTFVNETDRNLSVSEMTGSLEGVMGLREMYRITLASKRIVKADAFAAADLKVEPGSDICLMEGRQELSDNPPMAQYLQIYTQKEIGEKIPLGEMEGRGFFVVLEKAAMETAVQFNQIVYATAADEKTASVIQVPAGSPLLVNRNIFLSRKGRILGVVVRYSPGDVHRIVHRMKMHRRKP